MTNYLVGFIVVLMIFLIIVVVLFAVLDRMLKGGSTKKAAPKNQGPKKTPIAKPTAEPTVVNQTPPVMKIYNSELADDLNEMLKSADNSGTARLQIENHINKESHIAKYLQSKNYRSFNFGDDETADNTADEPLSFTREDYKRIMALSNIDDQKPL
ncbi:MAG: hypothetical protein NC133_00300 [Prevotella sp.]|nr:hypothetical protein [Prevotella sp.]